MLKLVDDPDHFFEHLHWYVLMLNRLLLSLTKLILPVRLTGTVVQSVAYGESLEDDVNLLKLGLENVDIFTKVTQGYAVDFWTWCTSHYEVGCT